MKEWSNKPASALLTANSTSVQASGSTITTSGALPAASAKGGSTILTAGTSTVTASTPTAVTTSKAAAGLATVAPLAAGAIVSAIATACYGVANMIQYAKNKKSGMQASRDTVVGSSGLGVSAAAGVATGHAIAGTSIVLGSTVVAPIALGAGAAYVCAKFWNKLFFNGKKDSKKKTT